MSAREELHEILCGSCRGSFSRGECEAVDRVIDAYAHELAGRQRLRMDELDLTGQTARIVGRIADLIDPEAQR